MKSRLFILFLAGVVAFSCGKESTEKGEGGEKQPIRFSTLLTKGTVVEDPGALAAQGGFNVWAYSHGEKWASDPAVKTPLFNGTTVTGSGSGSNVTWGYETAVNWPMTDYSSFFAYGPAGKAIVAGSNDDGVPLLYYGVESTVQNQSDLLISTPVYDQLGMAYSNAKPLNLFFNHVLSRVVFSGLLIHEHDLRDIKVKSIVLKNLYSRGVTPLSTPVSWTLNEEEMRSYELSIRNNNLKDVTLSGVAQDISTESGQLFMMPQPIARAMDSEPTVDVVLTIDENDVSYSWPLFSPDEWLPGKSYNYQIVVDGDDFEIIMISGDLDLEDWLVNIVIQPVPLTINQIRDQNRLASAMESLVFLTTHDESTPSVLPCKYFALYFKNDVNHDLTVNMASYTDAFAVGEQIIFDVEKLIGTWNYDESLGEPKTKYKVEVEFDPDYWKLVPSRQAPQPSLPEDVDARTTPTTLTPDPYIREKGSIIIERIEPTTP